MSFHAPNQYRFRGAHPLGTDDSYGNNGVFNIPVASQRIVIVASDGGGWEHVSVSIQKSDRTPSWNIMCQVKALFWDEEDCVIQYHPPKSEYVNMHPGCLHLWRPIGQAVPMPPSIFVGLKDSEKESK